MFPAGASLARTKRTSAAQAERPALVAASVAFVANALAIVVVIAASIARILRSALRPGLQPRRNARPSARWAEACRDGLACLRPRCQHFSVSAALPTATSSSLGGRTYRGTGPWAASRGSGLNERFAATLALFGQVRQRDASFANTIVRFWSGDPIATPELRRRLRDIGEVRPSLLPVAARELGGQRLRFVAKLLAAAGSGGWLILFDEVELIGRYSLQQRARSYAEIARWMRGEHGGPGVPIAAVLAMTDDFEAAVITGRNDRDLVPERLRAKQTPEAAALAAEAAQGMRIIDREMQLLTPPDEAELGQAYARLKELHGEAFGWLPPDVGGLERLGATRMRQYVRTWINEWDLVRLDPSYRPQTEMIEVSSDYREDPDLETSGGIAGSD